MDGEMKKIGSVSREVVVVDKTLKAPSMVTVTIDIVEEWPLNRVAFKMKIPKWISAAIYKRDGKGWATLNGPSEEHVIAQLNRLSDEILADNYEPPSMGEKTIFISFKASANQDRYHLNHGDLGIVHNVKFQYFIGWYWKGMVDNLMHSSTEKEIIWSTEKLSKHHPRWFGEQDKSPRFVQVASSKTDMKAFRERWIFVPHTAERESFLSVFESRMSELVTMLNVFMGDVTAESIDKMISNSEMLKLEKT